jgi:hypothetical protein
MYDTSHAIWSTHTYDNPGAYLELKNSGNLEIIKNNRTIWQTDTTDPRLWTPPSVKLNAMLKIDNQMSSPTSGYFRYNIQPPAKSTLFF